MCCTVDRPRLLRPSAQPASRARAFIRDNFNSEFPKTFAGPRRAFPGSDVSTAGAILAISRGERFRSWTGNVKRVFGAPTLRVEGSTAEKSVVDRLWQLSDACTPDQLVMFIPRRSWIWRPPTVCLRATSVVPP